MREEVWEGVVNQGIQTQDLHSARQGFVPKLLFPSPVEFFLVAEGGIVNSSGERVSARHGIHMVQAIILDGCVIEPRTIARLPLGATNHTKLGPASASHVVAALFQFDGGGAIEAALPAFFLRDLREP